MTGARKDQAVGTGEHRRLYIALAGVITVVLVVAALFGPRSVVVTASTSSLTLQFREISDSKYLGPIMVCRPSLAPASGPGIVRDNCPLEMNRYEPLGVASLAFAKGTRLEMRIAGERFEMRVLELPEGWNPEESGYSLGDVLSIPAAALRDFGQMAATAAVQIGTLPATLDYGTIQSGSYDVRGRTILGFIPGFRDFKTLRSGDLRRGGRVRLVRPHADDDTEEDATAYVQLMPAPGDEVDRAISVMAVSEYGPVALSVEYFLADRLLVRPTIADLVLQDAILQVLALVATVLGLVAGAYRLLVASLARRRRTE